LAFGLGARVAPPFASRFEIFFASENGGSELRFEVNGQMFFVNFVPEEGRWYCYAPTETGLQKIPVSMDAAPFEAFTVDVDEQAKEVVN
jgi:hypothetical protein